MRAHYLFIGLWACKGGGSPNPAAISRSAALESFAGPNACADLEAYLEDTAVHMMRAQLEEQRDDAIYWASQTARYYDNVSVDAPSAQGSEDSASKSSAPEASAPQDYTTTNNQVDGVDEADFVKNDGTRIFVLSGRTLYAVKSWPANEASVLGSLPVAGWPRELFLDGKDKAVVFSSVYKRYPLSHAYACDGFSMACGYSYANSTLVSVVDVSDMSHMKVVASYEVPGVYNTARKIGGSVRVVLTDNMYWPEGVRWYPENIYWRNPASISAAYDNLIKANEVIIRAQTIRDWLPVTTLKDAAGERELPYDCSDFSKVNAPTKLGLVSVVTLDLAAQSLDQRAVLAGWGQVYASKNSLYIATPHWWWWREPGQKDATYLHKFDIQSPAEARYVASGTVDGLIVDQFSMDEASDGYFRIVTTISTRVEDERNRWGRMETTNRLWVYGEHEGTLVQVGASDELAPTERVMSSRFIGNKAFVVTFRQIDPLFTFDLSEPTQPKLMGELKIPGFSTYLHPLDDTHLLAIGTINGSIQLSIFDVSDMSHPTQTHTQIVGAAHASSEAQWDHRAFNYFAAKKLLAIPYAAWDWQRVGSDYWTSFTSELKVFSVDVQTGFTARGSVALSDLYRSRQYSNWTYYWTPAVRRSVMADDFVYAISDAGLRVSNVADLSQPLATAAFTPAQ